MGSAAATPPAASQDAGSVPWRITGDWWDLCNCAIGCPCVFGSALGYCEGVLTWLIDDRASPDQREALETVFTGKAGGIFEAWHDLTISVDGVEFVPMNVSHDGEAWRVEVPGLVEGLGGPSPQIPGAGERYLPDLQRAAARSVARPHQAWTSTAQHRDRGFRPQL